MDLTATQTTRPRLRPIALPLEHGGWALLLEPALLGILVSPSWAGLLLAVAALGAFLCRHPLSLAMSDLRRGKRYPRTSLALGFAVGYGLLSIVALVGALLLAVEPFWLALVLALPFGLLQLIFDIRRRSRQLLAELAGVVALGALAPAISLASGGTLSLALALWAVICARGLPAIIYVRARLRLIRGEPISIAPALFAHIIALIGVIGLTVGGWLPWLASLAVAGLLIRAWWFLDPRRVSARAVIVGAQETTLGLLTVALVALGFTI